MMTPVFRLYIVTAVLGRPADVSDGYCVLGVKKSFYLLPSTSY